MDDSAPTAVSGLRTEVFVLKRDLMLLNILRHGIRGGGILLDIVPLLGT
jgi:hypothetical protein